jgi:hypothetical protein
MQTVYLGIDNNVIDSTANTSFICLWSGRAYTNRYIMYFYFVTLFIKAFLRTRYPNNITTAYVQEHLCFVCVLYSAHACKQDRASLGWTLLQTFSNSCAFSGCCNKARSTSMLLYQSNKLDATGEATNMVVVQVYGIVAACI